MSQSKFIVFSFFAIILLGTSSCRKQKIHKKEITEHTQKADTVIAKAETPLVVKVDSAAILKDLEAKFIKDNFRYKDIDFNYLNLKTKVDFLLAGDSQSFPASIHIKKDSAIWISVAIGLEAARGLITQNEITFLDRLHRTYYQFTFAELSKQFNFDLNFELVQAIIVGNMPIMLRSSDNIAKVDNYFRVAQQENRIAVNNFINLLTNKLMKIEAIDTGGNSNLKIDYDDFSIINQEVMPRKVNASIEAKRNDKIINTSVRLEHTKVEFLNQNPGFPFTIPKTYEKAKALNGEK